MRPTTRAALALIALAAIARPAAALVLEQTDVRREIDIGRQVARQVERAMPLATDPVLQNRVQRLGQAIVEGLDPRPYPIEFKVLAVPDYNAFAVPGGHIYVFEGLLAATPDDNALAFVLAHEVAHLTRRHWASQVEKMKGVSLLGAIAGAAIGGSADLVAGLATALVYLKYSRGDEHDADATAVEYLWRAGFAPSGALVAMGEIAELEEGVSVPRYLRNHPPAQDRLGRLKEKCEEVSRRPPPPPREQPGAPSAELPDLTALVGTLPEVEAAPNLYFPLGVGDSWTYSVQQGAGPASRYTVRVASSIPIPDGPPQGPPGDAVYRVEIRFGSASSTHQFLTTAGQVWMRSPAASDSSWRVEHVTDLSPDEVSEANGAEFTLVGVEPISVPCGAFPEARRIRRRCPATGAEAEMWFAPGVGMLKRVDGRNGLTETLTAYRIAAAAPPPTGPAEPAPQAEPAAEEQRPPEADAQPAEPPQ